MTSHSAAEEYWDWLFSEEGQRENKRLAQEHAAIQRARYHAARFRRDADRHDRRIPFETRVAVLERANEHCEYCGCFIATGFTVCLELHHLTYDRAYGNELPEDLMALCRDCHAGKHGMR
jgi:5-methylcytosine-specific restriction endonuclease McrA